MNEEEPMYCVVCGAMDYKIYPSDSPDYERCGHYGDVEPHIFCESCGAELKYPSPECHYDCFEAETGLEIEHNCRDKECIPMYILNS